MSSAVRYQVMPPLSSEEYQELHDDIKVNGVLEPIHVDEEGVVIDGHHRSKIASELVSVNASSAEDRKLLALELIRVQPFFSDLSIGRGSNLSGKTIKRIRRNALAPTREEAIKAVIVKSGHLSDRELSRTTGASRGTIRKYRKELSNV